ncbi:MAG: Asp23/Gls24 family envelope stress response protein [Thermaceae bacterium]
MTVDYEITEGALSAALLSLEGVRLLQVGKGLGELFKRARPVRVEREPEGLVVDLILSVDYSQPIPALAQEVQKAVAEALFVATGEKVKAVNLTVAQVEYRTPSDNHAA